MYEFHVSPGPASGSSCVVNVTICPPGAFSAKVTVGGSVVFSGKGLDAGPSFTVPEGSEGKPWEVTLTSDENTAVHTSRNGVVV